LPPSAAINQPVAPDNDARRSAARAVASFASRVAKEHGARTFPHAAQTLLRATSEPGFRIDDVVKVIESDPALTAQTLGQVNSAVFARRTRCVSVHQAVTLLGAEALRSIATTAGVLSMFDDLAAGPAAKVVEHGKLVGAIARRLAPFVNLAPDEMYTCGLLHDVGKLMLLSGDDLDYPDMLGTYEGFDAICAREREEYGFDHGVLAGHVLKAWRIPAPVPRVVGWHHQPERAARAGGSFARRVALVRLADRASYALNEHGFGPGVLPEALAGDASLRLLGLSTFALENMREWLLHEGFGGGESRATPPPSGRAAARAAPASAPPPAAVAAAPAAAPGAGETAEAEAADGFEAGELSDRSPGREPPPPEREAWAEPEPERETWADLEPEAGLEAGHEDGGHAGAAAPPSEARVRPPPLPPSQRLEAAPKALAEEPPLEESEADLEAWFLSEPTPEDGTDEDANATSGTFARGDEAPASGTPAPAPADAGAEAATCAQCGAKPNGRRCPHCASALCQAHAPKGKKYCGRCEGSYDRHRTLHPFEPLAVCLSASLFLVIGLAIGFWARVQHGPRWERIAGVALPVGLAEFALALALLGARRAQRAQFFTSVNPPAKK
jgi:HD-like signal output (HDOD) protein